MPKNNVTDPITHQEMAFAHLKISRDQILDRLWELANLSHEVTRGIIAGQIRALTMIVAIEGLIPDRRSSSSPAQPVAPPVKPDIYAAEWLRKQQNQAADEEPTQPVADTETQPPAPQIPGNPYLNPGSPNWVPDAGPFRLPVSPDRRFSRRRR
jgi:hypothetical protein